MRAIQCPLTTRESLMLNITGTYQASTWGGGGVAIVCLEFAIVC